MFFLKRGVLFCALLLAVSPAFGQGFDHSEFNHFLTRYVDAKGRVNYAAAKQDRSELDAYLKKIEKADRKQIEDGPKPEYAAFWLNVYHAGLISLILDSYPIKSTQEIPSFWERQFLKVGLKSNKDKTRFSLGQIRNEFLIPKLEDEKIHFALALAAQDGPLFPTEVFTGPRVLGQLFKCTRREVNRPEMVQINEDTGQVRLSRIFEWYAPDFVKNYGRPERRAKLGRTDTAIVNFLIRFAKDMKRLTFLKSANFKIEYPSFDWTLNDTVPA